MTWPTHPRAAEVARLAAEGLTVSEIARRTHLQYKVVWKIVEAFLSVRAVAIRAGGGRGRKKLYDRGPTWSEIPRHNPTIEGWFQNETQPPPPPPATARMQVRRFRLRLFEDEMSYRDPEGVVRRWTVGAWSGDYKTWTASGVAFYEFTEKSGKWRLVFLKRPVEVRAAGRKARVTARRWVGSIVLMPSSLMAGPETIDRAEEAAFAAALDLMREIRENRRLLVDGIPEPVGPDDEFGFAVEEHESLPRGKHVLAPGLWIDRSRRGGKPEIETSSPATARALALTLPMLERAPDIPVRLENIEAALLRIEKRLDELEWK